MVKLTRILLMLLPASYLSVSHGVRYGLLRVEPIILVGDEKGKEVGGTPEGESNFSASLYLDDAT